MLYLEDFLELIEQLPAELVDRFTELRTLDLSVQNGLDLNEKMVADLFRNALSMSAEERKEKYAEIRKAYKNILNDADEKVTIANTMYDIVERYQRKLEGEVQKFKIELEADNPGITAALEQKVRESEQAARQLKREQQRRKRKLLEARMGRVTYLSDRTPSADSPLVEQIQHSLPSSAQFQKPIGIPSRPPASSVSSSLVQGRRIQSYPSRLSDIKALNAGGNTAMYPMPPGGMAGAALIRPGDRPGQPAALLNAFSSIRMESRHGRPRKMTTKVQEMLKESMHRERNRMDPSAGGSGEDEGEFGNDDETQGEEADGDQRKWCICNKSSHGEMVACDNEKCPFEWFHYGCVGIDKAPKGKWFCPH